MKILLTGMNGQLGFELLRSLAPLGEVLGVDRAGCDLARPDAIRQLVRGQRPDIVVNAAAYTAVDQAESDEARAQAVNATAPGVLAEEARALGALLVHYSTDYVFDGLKNAPYTEQDAPAPQSVYGRSKLEGERAIALALERHLILRTSWVYGAHGSNFARTMLRLGAERDRLTVVSDQCGAPTAASLLADVTAQVLRQWLLGDKSRFPWGLYHVAAAGETTWHGYASHLLDRARQAGWPVRVAQEDIRPCATTDYPAKAKRPANSRLETAKFRAAFGLTLPPWQSGVQYLLQQLQP